MTREDLARFLSHALRGRVQFVNFLAVGALNAAFGYVIFASSLWLGAPVAIAAAIATVLGTLFNFKTTGTLVFGSSDVRLVPRFLAVYLVLYCMNVAGLWALTHLGITPYIGGLMMILPLALLSYVLNRRFVFSR